jgi:excisionase family DNA binding protein
MKKTKRGGTAYTGKTMTVGEAAEFLGIARQNVLKLIERRTVRSVWERGKFGPQGGRYRIPLDDVAAYRGRALLRARRSR